MCKRTGPLALLATAALIACASAAAPAAPELGHFLQKATELEDWLVSTRRLFHTFPELQFAELNTSATIRRYLDELQIPYK